MLLGTHCPYCPAVLKGLSELVKSGAVGKLEAVNIEQHPDIARALGVRSVPWVRIGPFELEGLRSEKELRTWAEAAGTETGYASYLDELLSTGKIDRAIKLVQKNPHVINALLALFSDPETQLNTRIGISAIIENLAGSELLQEIVDRLGELSRHDDPRIRGDAAHYLGLTGSAKAMIYLERLVDDADGDVKAVARESLDMLRS
ncbi:MAG: HEAT repeat domain-containing protein [Gammaproteobacteria bacterium]